MIKKILNTVKFAFFLWVLALPVNVQAIDKTFFGEDLSATEDGRLNSHPNADSARANFLNALAGVLTENFDTAFANNQPAPLTVNLGVLGSATIQGTGQIIRLPAVGTLSGRYPISGEYYWDSGSSFYIEFSQPIVAIGFYGTDLGDFSGQITVTLEYGSNNKQYVIPHTINGNGGSVVYFGLINTDTPFNKITFGNTQPGTDLFGLDDLSVTGANQVKHILSLPVILK